MRSLEKVSTLLDFSFSLRKDKHSPCQLRELFTVLNIPTSTFSWYNPIFYLLCQHRSTLVLTETSISFQICDTWRLAWGSCILKVRDYQSDVIFLGPFIWRNVTLGHPPPKPTLLRVYMEKTWAGLWWVAPLNRLKYQRAHALRGATWPG